MGSIITITDPTIARRIAVLAASDATSPELHRVVDHYIQSDDKAALCVHDADLESVLSGTYTEFVAGNVQCPAGVTTTVFSPLTMSHDLSPYRYAAVKVENVGANPYAECCGYDVSKVNTMPATLWISTVTVNPSAAGIYRCSANSYATDYAPGRALGECMKVTVLSASGTTVTVRVRAWRF